MNAGAPILAVFSEPRERIYRALLAESARDWRVSQSTEQVPQVSVEAVRTTLYLLLGDGLVEEFRIRQGAGDDGADHGRVAAFARGRWGWVVSVVRARVAARALAGPEEARHVIEDHLRSDVGGRCLACGELEPCRQRDTAHAVLFGHDRQLPHRRPMELIGARGDFAATDGQRFDAFGKPDRPRIPPDSLSHM